MKKFKIILYILLLTILSSILFIFVFIQGSSSNIIWIEFLLGMILSVLFISIGFILRYNKIRYSFPLFVIGFILALCQIISIVHYLYTKHKEMSKVQGIYKVIKVENFDELCLGVSVDTLILTLNNYGHYTFNFKPCFAETKEGSWKWQDDMVGTYFIFDANLKNSAYLNFDDKGVLKVKRDDKDYLIFEKWK